MRFDKTFWGACASTTLFVLLWGSGAIFARLGLDHASAFAFLTLRFILALGALLLIGTLAGHWLPARGQRLHTAGSGLLTIGGYSICYLLALDHGITPGVLATLLGVQPILTLMLLERRFAALRLAGLARRSAAWCWWYGRASAWHGSPWPAPGTHSGRCCA